MALKALNSVAGFSVGETSTIFIDSNGNITTSNLSMTGNAWLGNIGNVIITGGTAGQFIQTDGAGNLSFVTIGTAELTNGNSNIQVLANSNVVVSVGGTANVAVFSTDGVTVVANVSAGNIKTDNLLYANGTPWDLQEAAGANYEIQYNIDDNFAASANFTYNDTTQLLTVVGNIQVNNANLGNLATANYVNVVSNIIAGNITSNALLSAGNANVTSNVTTGNLTVNAALTGNTANFSSNVVVSNLSVNLEFAGNTANFSSNVVVSNLSVNLELAGNTANFANVTVSGTVDSGNVKTPTVLNGNSNVQLAANGNVSVSVTGTSNVAVFTTTGLDVPNTLSAGNVKTDNLLYANGAPWDLQAAAGANYEVQFNLDDDFAASANFTYNDTTQLLTVVGNIQVNNANLGNLATANYVNVVSNIIAGNITSNALLSAGNANISANLITGNLTVNAALTGNTANFSSNVVVSNLSVNLELAGNTANFANVTVSGTLDSGNVRTSEIINGNSNIRLAANGNVSISAIGTGNVVVISDLGANVVGYIEANGNVTAGAFYGVSLTSNVGNLTLYANPTGDNFVELKPSGNGHVDVANTRIQNLADPVSGQDAATKNYVDTVAQGLHIHAPVEVATTDTLANITSGTTAYNNGGGGNGIGAYISTTGTFDLIDGINVQTSGTRILVKNEANAAWNGIYTFSNTTAITRATDADINADMKGGDFVFVRQGTVNADTGWVMTSDAPNIGTSNIVWDQFYGPGTYTGANGISVVGTVITANVDNITTEISGGNIVVKASANLTTPNIGAATGTSLDITGNLLAGNVNSNALVSASNVSVTSNVVANNISANSNVSANYASFAGTGNALTITNGNISTNEVFGAGFQFVNAPYYARITGSPTVAANYTLSLPPNAGSSGQVLSTDGTGNLSFVTIDTWQIQNGNSNVQVAANSNVTISVAGNANIATFTGTGANITGTLGVTGNLVADNIKSNGAVVVGNTTINDASVVTSSITANQNIASISTTGVTGLEFLVKGIDTAGSKYSIATVQAVTDGTNVDYIVFASIGLGTSTGTLAVNVSGGHVRLQVTPTSSNNTTWTVQTRFL